jgi:uncharacterized protein YgiM (DUF1202 family)
MLESNLKVCLPGSCVTTVIRRPENKRRKYMRIDKRGIECGTLVAFLGVLALGTATFNTVTPNIASEYSANTYVTSEESAVASLNAGMPVTFTLASIGEAKDAAATTELAAPEVVADGTGINWNVKCMTTVSGSVNIREAADAGSALVGKLFEGGAADVVEKGETWTLITSGSVTGYIANEFLVFGDDAAALAKEKGLFVSTVLENTIRIRKEPSAEAGVLGLVGTGERLETVNTTPENGFIAVKFGDDTGYISQEFVTTELDLPVAKSMAEIKAEEAAKKAAEQKAAAAKAAKEAKNNAARTQNAAVAASADDVSLLASIVMCEAGNQSYECKLGIASVVMNRVRSGRYPNTIYGVLYQRGQFPPASVTGRVAAVLASGRYNSGCLQAAQEALSGVSNVGNAIGFAHAGSRSGTVIGPIVFF